MSSKPEYKSSNIDWLKKIPSHWTAYRLANTGSFSKGKGIAKADIVEDGKPAILYGDIYTRYSIVADSLERKVSDETAANAVAIHKGDLLFTGSGETPIDIGRCVCYTGTETGYAGGDIIIYRQNSIDGKFLSYMFNSFYLDQQKAILAKGGIIIHIYPSQLKSIKFPLPPAKEQHQIATYLDRETARIDALIDAKERLLRVLEEKRSVMIAEAVTRGLDAEVSMKDSGVDWLGAVPEHWGIRRIKDVVTKVGSGVTPSGGAKSYLTEGIPFLRSQNIHFDGLRLDDVVYISEETHQKMSNSQVYPEDVLLNITGASIGRTYFVEPWLVEANVNQHVCILRSNNKVDYRYLHLVLSSTTGQEQVKLESTGAGREGLTFEAIKGFTLTLPPLVEQLEIIGYVSVESTRFDEIMKRTVKSIDLLKERRSALITAAVTGRVKI